MSHLPPTNDDRVIWDMWESQFRLPATTVADELGVFKALGDAPLTTEELAARVGAELHPLSILLAALASSELLEKREGKWRALPPARTWLHPEAEGYWGGFLLGYRERNPLHGQLLEAMRTGKRPESFNSGAPEWERGAMSAEAAQRIASFMHSHSMAPARGAAAQAVFGEVRHLMDVGCGSGVYGIEIASAHPNLRVTLMDLAAMADAHFFANVFHDWSVETNTLLAKKSFDALPSGGRIFLSEILMDDDGAGPWHAAAFSLLMLIGTLGKQYSLPEFRAMLESVGFTDVQAVRTGGGYYSLVSARKP